MPIITQGEVVSSNRSIYLTSRWKKDILFAITLIKEKQKTKPNQNKTIEKLWPVNILHFCLKNDHTIIFVLID